MFNRKSVSVLTLLLVLTLAGTTIASAGDAASTRSVGVTIDSRPDHAEVHVDGKFVGTTPLPYRLSPGDHDITLSRPHYSKWSRVLTVKPEISTRVVAILDEAEKQPAPCR